MVAYHTAERIASTFYKKRKNVLFSAENVHILIVNFFSAHADKVRRDLRQVPRDGRADERRVEPGILHGDDGIGADQLCVKELLARLDGTVKEVIMATSPTVEGEATAMYLAKLIKPLGIKTTRLAYGLPVGSSLEYADETTLYRAMEGRGEM